LAREQDRSSSGAGGLWIAVAAAGLAACLLTLFLVASAREATANRIAAEALERHTLTVIVEGERLNAAFADMQRGARGYLITAIPEMLEPYLTGRAAAARHIAALRHLTRDNRRQQGRLARLDRLNREQLDYYTRTIALTRDGRTGEAFALVRSGDGQRYLNMARALTNAIVAEEERLLRIRSAAAEAASAQVDRFNIWLAVLALVLAVLAFAGAIVALRSRQRARLATLRAENDARFRVMSDTMPAFIFVSDRQGANIYTNAVFQHFTGLDGAALLGDGWLQALHPDDRARAATTWTRACQSGEPYEAEYRFRRDAAGYRWFLVRGTPMRDGEGRIVQWVGACIDVQDVIDARNDLATLNATLEARIAERTAELSDALVSLRTEILEREAAEAQMRQMQKMEAIGSLTGGIAHDFNNMLAIVVGSLDMARRRLPHDPARALEKIGNAEEGARRAAQLTARLLAFSRQSPLAPEPLDANKLVAGMSELLRRTIAETVRVETVLAGGLWRTFADASQLENALVNLCVNARDAMPDGGRLTIETLNAHLDDSYAVQHNEVIAGQYVAVCVTDTGTGMPPEVVDRAFDPFYTTKGPGKGTGLGLSQVFGFVKQSGGHVKIYSEPGEGTTVKLYLPRYFGTAAERERSEAGGGALPRARDGEVVLVVEDESGVRHLSVDALRDLGYVVVQAADANQALEVLAVQPRIDLLFTDIVMPEMDGRRLADAALVRRPDLRILYTTGYTRNAVVHNGMLDPGVAFLPKPFTIDALATKVRAVLDGGGVNRSG
jgi:PAS domain S-box-containing protein